MINLLWLVRTMFESPSEFEHWVQTPIHVQRAEAERRAEIKLHEYSLRYQRAHKKTKKKKKKKKNDV